MKKKTKKKMKKKQKIYVPSEGQKAAYRENPVTSDARVQSVFGSFSFYWRIR